MIIIWWIVLPAHFLSILYIKKGNNQCIDFADYFPQHLIKMQTLVPMILPLPEGKKNCASAIACIKQFHKFYEHSGIYVGKF